MFSIEFVSSDKFVTMPLSTQALYFHLCMNADDDGFLDCARRVQNSINANDDDMKLLITKGLVIPFNNGVYVITHWNIHNFIRADRYKPTHFLDEKVSLALLENGTYTLAQPSDNQCATNGCQVVNTGKVSIDKNSVGKVSVEEVQEEKQKMLHCNNSETNCNTEKEKEKEVELEKEKEVELETSKSKRFTPPTYEEVENYCIENNYTVNAERFVDFYEAKGWLIGKNKMKDWKAAVRTWERKQKEQREEETKKGLSPRERLLARLNNPLDFENIVEEDFRRYNE